MRPTSPLPARGRLAVLLLGILALVATLLPVGASAQSDLRTGQLVDPNEYGIQGEGEARVQDVDRRLGSLAPTATQEAIAADLGATRVTWNDFGTPHVLINHGGYLSGPTTGDAVSVARAFVRANADLYRLSGAQIDDLELLVDSPLYDAPDLARARDGQTLANPDVAHVVLFRQRFGDLTAAQDGLLNVGVAADGRVAWTSSTVTGDDTVSGARTITPVQAVTAVAEDIGFDLGELSLSTVADAEWTLVDATTTKDVQRVRPVALPTPTNGVRAAWEVTLLASEPDADGHGNPVAHIAFVDAEDATVWMRTNRVEHAADGEASNVLAQAAPQSGQFSGSTIAGACDPVRTPIEVGPGQGTITVSVAATTPPEVSDDDILINLYFGAEVVASMDVLTSPEVLTYSPGGELPEGTYDIEICPFNGAAAPPIPYQGQFSVSAGGAPSVGTLPRWRVFPTNPPLTTDADPSEDTRVLWCWTITNPNCERDVQNTAARVPWDSFVGGDPSLTTAGNYASTAISEASFLTPDTAADRPAPDPTRDYQATWENKWFESKCDPSNFAVDNDDDASTYNLFVMHNRMHDWSYYLGFTEGNANLQMDNFGNDGVEGDPELGSSQAGRLTFNGRDNANQITLQDGVPGITNQYLWEPLAGAFYATCTDGAYDMAIVAHEYAHAISTRMTAGPDATLSGSQGQSESWSDLAFAEYFRGFGFTAGEGVNPFALAPLVTGDPDAGIRSYGMNDSPLNYSDIQYDGNGTTSPHADGEIWSAINYDVAIDLNAKYDAAFPSDDEELQADCARGERAADDCPGNRRWAQLMFDGFLMQPARPSMVDSRDAMLAADMLRFDGENQDTLWASFAGRGLGEDAVSDGASDIDPTPSFASPRTDDEATVTFVAAGDGDAATEMSVFVGDYEGRITPIATTFDENADVELEEGETAPADITDTADFVPGVYNFIATAPGFGGYRFSLTLGAGQDVRVNVPLRTNVASGSNGATATGDGVNLDQLIDDTEATNWASLDEDADPDAEEGAQVEGRTVTIDLAGGAAVNVTEVAVSSALRPANNDAESLDPGSQSRFAGLRSFDILACNAGGGADCATDGGYTKIFASSDDAFDAQKPRPKAPDFTLRPFDVTDTEATHLRFVVRDNQCTGAPDYQGDANPVNDPVFSLPDCDSMGASLGREVLSPPTTQVRAAEVQVFTTVATEPDAEVVDSGGNDGGSTGGSTGGGSVVGGGVIAGGGAHGGSTGGSGGVSGTDEFERVSGNDRVETGIALVKGAFTTAETVILARKDAFPDALAAATLAAEVEGPLLLTSSTELEAIVAAEIERLGATKLYLVGGPLALSPAVESAANDLVGSVERLAGDDRFATAVAIADEVVELGGDVDRVILARSDTFPDALAAANLATYGRSPILLTRTGELPPVTTAALDDLLGTGGDVVITGGPQAINASVESVLDGDGYDTTRLQGQTRYGTSVAILEAALDEGIDLDPTLLASGENFPDALTAGPVAFRRGGALGLIHPTSLAAGAESRDFLRDQSDAIGEVVIVGGPIAITESVTTELAILLGRAR